MTKRIQLFNVITEFAKIERLVVLIHGGFFLREAVVILYLYIVSTSQQDIVARRNPS